jgi:polyisoprenoid-binding protein YceI
MAGQRRRLRWWIVGVVVVVVLLVGGPFVYIHLIEGPAPDKLSLPPNRTGSVTTPPPSSSTVSGVWNVGAGSTVGYRVQEVLVGQHSTAVGRTTRVSGSISISGTSVVKGSFTVDMSSVKSDQSERNDQFDGRIMDVSAYPLAKFVLTNPIALDAIPAGGTSRRYSAIGDLTMHGVTKSVTFTVSAERRGATIYVLADIPIVFADWNISNPSVGGFVTTQSTGTLEVLLDLTRGPGNAAVTGSSGAGSSAPGGGGPVTVPKTTVPELTVPSG